MKKYKPQGSKEVETKRVSGGRRLNQREKKELEADGVRG